MTRNSRFAIAHRPGFRSAPGGQLIQATDSYIGVMGSRVALMDDDGTRAVMAASWLIQMGWRDVVVLKDGLSGPLVRSTTDDGVVAGTIETVAPLALLSLTRSSMAVMIIDLSPRETFLRAHIPGSVWASRTDIDKSVRDFDNVDLVVITADRDDVSFEVARELGPVMTYSGLRVMQGGVHAWATAGLPTDRAAGAGPSSEEAGKEAHFIARELRKYLTWEIGLVEQMARDGDAAFRVFK